MKTLHIITLSLAALAIVSCGTARKAQVQQAQYYPNYGGYQPQPAQGYYQQPPQGYYGQQPQAQGYYQQPQQGMYQGQAPQYQQQYRPEMTEEEFIRHHQEEDRDKNPCKYLAEHAPSTEIRAFGEGIGFDSSSARLEAEIAAERELVSKLYAFASAAVESISKNIATGPTSTEGGRVTQLKFEDFAEGSISGWRVLLSKEEKMPSGVNYKVCLTMSLDNAIKSSFDILQKKNLINDITAFRSVAESIQEKYRLQNTGTNQQLQQQQADFNMQSQIKDQEFQREQQRVQQQQQYELQQQQQQQNYNLQQQQQQYNYQLQQQQQNNNYQLQQQQNSYQQQQNYNPQQQYQY